MAGGAAATPVRLSVILAAAVGLVAGCGSSGETLPASTVTTSGTSASTTVPSTTVAATSTTTPPLATLPSIVDAQGCRPRDYLGTAGEPPLCHPESPTAVGPLDTAMDPAQVEAILGPPSFSGWDDNWDEPVYRWQLSPAAWIRYQPGQLMASCDPAGDTSIALPGGLSLCGSTLGDLIRVLGDPPHTEEGCDCQVLYGFDPAGNLLEPGPPYATPHHAIKAGAGVWDPDGEWPPPNFPTFGPPAFDDSLTWYWVYTDFY